MNLFIPTLAIVLIAGAASALIAVTINTRKTRHELDQRINVVAQAVGDERLSGVGQSSLGTIEKLFTALLSLGLAEKWGVHTAGRTLLMAGLTGAVSAWLMFRTLLHMPVWLVAPIALAAFLGLPRLILIGEQGRASALFTERFPDAIDTIIRMLRAGLPITAAIRTVGSEASPPVNVVFAGLADQMSIGMPLEQALAVAGDRIHQPDFRFFTVAVALQSSTGGNLTSTLEILSDIIRRRRAMRMKAKAVSAEVRMTAYVLGAIPFVIVGGLLVVNPAYLQPLIADPRGNLLAGAAITSLLTGFLIMRQMMRHAIRL